MLSDFFFPLALTFVILFCIIGLTGSFLTLFIVIRNRQFHTFYHLLACNACVAAIFYLILSIIGSIYAFYEDWAMNSPLCSVRAYLCNVAIAALCYSSSTQAISRLFHAVYYKHRSLLTWRTHFLLIILTWLIAILICLPPFFVDGGYALENESRSCLLTSKLYKLAFYIIVVSSLIPHQIMTGVYIKMVREVYRSTRQVWTVTLNGNRNVALNQRIKREIRMIRKMAVNTVVFSLGGMSYVILVIWHATQSQSPPQPLYLIAFHLITLAISSVPFVYLLTNTQLKEFLQESVHRPRPHQ